MSLDTPTIIGGTTVLWIVTLILLIGMNRPISQWPLGLCIGCHIAACYLLTQGQLLIPVFCWLVVASASLMAARPHPVRGRGRHER